MSKNMAKSYDTVTTYAFPSDLDDADRNKISQAINPLIADVFTLFIKTKNFHWHISGSHFRDYHLLLDEQAGQIFAMIDVLAERVRKLGKNTIHSISQIAQLQKIKDNNKDYVAPQEMIEELMNDNKKLIQHMRLAHEVCDKGNDVATASLLENFIDETERRAWFLFETQID
jgi:starvation-inducible DNA-binding protein